MLAAGPPVRISVFDTLKSPAARYFMPVLLLALAVIVLETVCQLRGKARPRFYLIAIVGYILMGRFFMIFCAIMDRGRIPWFSPWYGYGACLMKYMYVVGIPVMVICTPLSIVYLWKDRRGRGKVLFACRILLLAAAVGVGIDTLTYPARHIDRLRLMSVASPYDLWPPYWYRDGKLPRDRIGVELFPLARHGHHLDGCGTYMMILPDPDTYSYKNKKADLATIRKHLHIAAQMNMADDGWSKICPVVYACHDAPVERLVDILRIAHDRGIHMMDLGVVVAGQGGFPPRSARGLMLDMPRTERPYLSPDGTIRAPESFADPSKRGNTLSIGGKELHTRIEFYKDADGKDPDLAVVTIRRGRTIQDLVDAVDMCLDFSAESVIVGLEEE